MRCDSRVPAYARHRAAEEIRIVESGNASPTPRWQVTDSIPVELAVHLPLLDFEGEGLRVRLPRANVPQTQGAVL